MRGDLVDRIESDFEWSERAIESDRVGQGRSEVEGQGRRGWGRTWPGLPQCLVSAS